jgi:peptidoglycan/xylan/chitin deacetylase (PgdA/CDA1 family)
MKLSRLYKSVFLLLLFSPWPAVAGDHAVAFIYHHFDVARYPSTNTSAADFERHLTHLKEQNFHVLPLNEIVARLQQGESLPARTVAITIDDAYESVFHTAAPLLERYGFPATVFVSTDYIDQHLNPYMSWNQMRQLQQRGFSFANHSRSHAYLVRRQRDETLKQWQDRIRKDIRHAQQRLADELGVKARLFAYPYGEYSTALADIVTKMGYAAFGQHSGVISRFGDLSALPRFPMGGRYADIDDFRLKALTLPMPVLDVKPTDPLRHDDTAPRMRVTLDTNDIRRETVRCYVSGVGSTPLNWSSDNGPAQFTVQSPESLPVGRSRYNCTAPSLRDPSRYYWFSHLWIRRP